MKIGLITQATYKYKQFLPRWYESVKKYFFTEDDVRVFVFSDKEKLDIPVFNILIEHEPWPGVTLHRYRNFYQAWDRLEGMFQWVFYSDVDMELVNKVDKEILPTNGEEIISVLHPGFWNGGGSWETRKESMAYVPLENRKIYVAGGFQGGSHNAFYSMCRELFINIEKDERRGIKAIWQDESHFNSFISTRQVHLLSPAYCYPENCSWFTWQGSPKVLALNKNHEVYQK